MKEKNIKRKTKNSIKSMMLENTSFLDFVQLLVQKEENENLLKKQFVRKEIALKKIAIKKKT